MKRQEARSSIGGGDALFLMILVMASYGMTLVPNLYLQYAWLAVLMLTVTIHTGTFLYRIASGGNTHGE